MTVRNYSLAYSQGLVLGLIVLAGMFAVGVWMLSKQLTDGNAGAPQLAFWVVWFGFLVFGAFRTLTAARRIVVHERDEIEFISAVERQRVLARDINSIRVQKGRYLQIVVRHRSGRIYLAGAINDFHQFLTDLKQANPGVELVGC